MLFISAAAILALTVVFYMFREPKKTKFEPDVIARSQAYIRTLGPRPLPDLSTEQKLLLLHSYFNVGDSHAVVRLGESMTNELHSLNPERQKPFVEMVVKAYQNLHQKHEAGNFRNRFQHA